MRVLNPTNIRFVTASECVQRNVSVCLNWRGYNPYATLDVYTILAGRDKAKPPFVDPDAPEYVRDEFDTVRKQMALADFSNQDWRYTRGCHCAFCHYRWFPERRASGVFECTARPA